MIRRSVLLPALLSLPFSIILLAQSQPRQDVDSIRQEEARDYYQKWLKEDVVYIISPEERDVFLKLSTPDEKDAFIEQFWQRRDPEPKTSDNEYKIEHYRRIAFSNEKFTAGIIGWRTDRGRIYIMYGPPDRKESNAGGSYVRERKEGGGQTSVFPFEIWEYRSIPGIGDDIVLEFVDDEGGGLYELTFDNQRKDMLIHTGFLGPTLDEIEDYENTGSRLKQYRVADRRFAGDPAGIYKYTGYFETEKDKPFSKLMLSSALNEGPGVKFKDLEKVVETRIFYDQIPFSFDSTAFYISPVRALVAVTVNIPHQSLTFREITPGVLQGKAEVLGRFETIDGRTEAVFEEAVAQEVRAGDNVGLHVGSSVFQKQMLLPAGMYKLTLVVKDVDTGRLGASVHRVEIPVQSEESLGLSSVVLAQRIDAADEMLESPFRLGKLEVVPRVSATFRQDESLGFYFQIYNATIDQSSSKPDLAVEFSVAPSGQAPQSWRDCSRLVSLSGTYLTVARMTSLQPFAPGKYTLHIRVRDRITQQTTDRSVSFTVAEPQKTS